MYTASHPCKYQLLPELFYLFFILENIFFEFCFVFYIYFFYSKINIIYKGDILREIFLVLPIRHENEQIMRFFLSWWVTQVYNKTVIALYLDFIHSYLFCFYFDSANASSK